MDGTREFHALYDVLWKAKIDCAEES
jgi:hypothetical protein